MPRVATAPHDEDDDLPQLERLALTMLFAAMDALALAGHAPHGLVMTTVGHAAEAVDRLTPDR